MDVTHLESDGTREDSREETHPEARGLNPNYIMSIIQKNRSIIEESWERLSKLESELEALEAWEARIRLQEFRAKEGAGAVS